MVRARPASLSFCCRSFSLFCVSFYFWNFSRDAGHHAESILAGLALTSALLSGCGGSSGGPSHSGDGVNSGSSSGSSIDSVCHYPQQINPFTAIPEPGDGYGPMIMSLLEYTARRVGIVPLPRGTGAGKHALFLLFLSRFSLVMTNDGWFAKTGSGQT